jgi:hypothetical protein
MARNIIGRYCDILDSSSPFRAWKVLEKVESNGFSNKYRVQHKITGETRIVMEIVLCNFSEES